MGIVEERPGKVSFLQAIKDFFRGYVDFKGRTTRAGYWWLSLVFFILGLLSLVAIIPAIVHLVVGVTEHGWSDERVVTEVITRYLAAIIVGLLISLLLLLPSLALSVRRFRDAGMSGKGILVMYILQFLVNYFDARGGIGGLILSFVSIALSLYMFVLTVLPTATVTIRRKKGLLGFFFTEKDAFFQNY